MLSFGDTAPEIVSADLEEREQSLHTFLEQGPVLLAFFKISCPTCQLTFPFLQRIAEKSSLQVIGVSQDEPGPTQAFCEKFGVRFPVLLDRAAEGYQASNAYRISHVPSLFLVEKPGAVTKVSEGFSRQDLADLGAQFGATPFAPGESVPEFRPG